jgi:bacterioferritin-associated ferredoxin
MADLCPNCGIELHIVFVHVRSHQVATLINGQLTDFRDLVIDQPSYYDEDGVECGHCGKDLQSIIKEE